ncbi:MAG: CoB--CoM heterodisulfide reductase iron-sulfur subunit A family protein [Desulfobacteraceae bacterium]|nr:MAG: CoB--CoM heterodisulfide reductase iron-sulfur subunit A family protein [Desulfobacteraceae bacterium]
MTLAEKRKLGSVLVVGAGVAGIQASLDMANSGFYVHLVDRSPSVGGIMAQLDKTFPTNDCAMCVISPFLVEVGRHLNIHVIPCSELERLDGEKGDFKATIVNHPRYIDTEKCTGCGQCRQVCPVVAINEFNCGLDLRKATYIPYPQAVPLAYAIDRNACIGCGMCEKVCLAGAVTYDDKTKITELEVGSVILAPGGEMYDPKEADSWSYSHPNVVTSLEFERILSASGPYRGHLMRPYDREEPEKIAWLQCVGSRDINRAKNSHCSSVCCMYAIKQTMIAKEHSAHELDTAIFYMDMRTYGKDFDKYYSRAKEERGVRFIRSRVHSIEPVENGNLRLRYVKESGESVEEIFNMVVLSVGFKPSSGVETIAKKLGLTLNEQHFFRTGDIRPVATSRDGVYVCGVSHGPKDIPQSVMEASAAASVATSDLSSARWSATRTPQLPPETDFSKMVPRIGVFVCNCGINIGGVADVPAIREYAKTLPHVVHVEDNLFTCSQDTQERMKQVIREKNINRVVVASCSPRTHEPLFQETIREAGLNKYLFEMANIRDQNTWVHKNNPDLATAKAKDLVRMAVAKAEYIEPLHQVKLDVKPAVLIVGGGVAGMEAALGAAEQGFQAYLVEKTDTLGGMAHQLRKTWQGEDIPAYLERLIKDVTNHSKIQIFLNTKPVHFTGTIGSFTTTLNDIHTGNPNGIIEHGAAILATGGREYRPEGYQYGNRPDVMTHLDLDQAMKDTPATVMNADTIVFIQCVGSRNSDRPYCSRVCCTHTLKNAIELKKIKPGMNIFVMYRDVRSYGFRESLYQEARALGVHFIRFDPENPPQMNIAENNILTITVTDHILQRPIVISPDLVVLAAAVLPNENKELFELFKVPVNAEGFLVEAHAKLRPVDFGSEGLFLAGLAHYPKSIDESIAQARAAVSRAVTIVSKDGIMVGGVVAAVNPDRCAVCCTCVRACPYGIPFIGNEGHAVIQQAECHGCGVCVSECPGKAITLQHFTDQQLIAKTRALFYQPAMNE